MKNKAPSPPDSNYNASGTSRRLEQPTQGAIHESAPPLSAANAMDELLLLLDHLLAIGDAAFKKKTVKSMQQAHGLVLDGKVLTRVSELTHAVGATMDYTPSESDERTAVVEWLSAVRNLKARISPYTIGEADPANPAHQADARYLKRLIDGKVNFFSTDIFAKLEPMFIKYPDGSKMHALLEKAAEAFGDAAVAKAMEVLATPDPQLIDTILYAMREAQFAGRDAAVAEVARLQGRFALCGWAELLLTIERDSALWVGLFQAAKVPGADQIFHVASVGENEVELTMPDMKLTSQGASVHTCALQAALAILKDQLGVKGWVNTVLD
nr:hypothetical protein [uncultured Albidiferax sp.]